MRLRTLVVPIVVTLALAGCTGAASSPSAGGASPAGPTAAPTTAASSAQSPAASSAASPVASGGGASVDPSALGPIRVGVEAPGGEAYIPTQLTVKRLKEQGYDIEVTQFEDPDVMPQALDTGEIHINTNSSGQILSAVDAGLDVKAIMGLTDPDFVMVAKSDLKTCESLNGKKLAQQGTTGFGFASVTNWLNKECPGTQPQMLDIPGSENRAVALLQGQIDATSLHLLRARQLMEEKPNDFTIIESFTFPENVTSAWSYALTKWINDNPELYKAYVTTYADVVADIEADPQIAVDEGVATIPDAEAPLVTEVMKEWAKQGWWTAADGVSKEVFDATLAFYEDFTDYDKELTYEMVVLPPPGG
jgi:NitT/TauT family transport system substrate-binding protein